MLEGNVAINGHQILEYRVVNTEVELNGVVVYEVFASGHDGKGYPFDFHFDVMHRPGNGAVALVEIVMDELGRRMQ